MRRAILTIATLLFIVICISLTIKLYQHQQNSKTLTLYGNVDVRQVDIGFRVAGQVTTLLYEEGDLVEPNALMAVLDRRPYLDQVRLAAATVVSTKVALANAEKLVQRRLELVSVGGVAKEDLDNATASRDELKAQLKENRASLRIALDNLKFTKAYAPTEGTILTRIREPGTVVNPADPVYTLSVTSPVWIRAYVSEPELGIVYPGMEADIYTDTRGGPVYKGHVGFISPVSEFTPKTVQTTDLRTDLVYRIRIYADNPDKGLRQGMPVTCKLAIR
jgi:HlyD family secretion protein